MLVPDCLLRRPIFLFFAFFLTMFFSRAQVGSYKIPQTFPPEYNFHVEEAFKALNVKPLKGMTKEQSDAFRVSTIYGPQKAIDENEVYLGWYGVEDYVNRIFDTVIPSSYRSKYPFRIFIARDPTPNAYANDNGLLFVNIGLLASMRNEAALAATLGHEAGHSIYDHSYNQFVDYLAYEKNNPNVYFDYALLQNSNSRNYEMIADTFAFIKLAICGYNLGAIRGKFDIFKRGQQRIIHSAVSRYNDFSKTQVRNYMRRYSTHPMEEDRVKVAEHYRSKVFKKGGNFIVDSTQFQQIRKTAQEECKKLLFESSQFKECLRLAFIDYLYNGNNLKNLYYIIECIRRESYRDPKLLKRGFLTDEYADKEFLDYNQSILKSPALLFQDSLQEAELKGHPLLAEEKKPFNTYAEAFTYFCDRGIQLNLNEARFSKALFNYAQKNETEFTANCESYLAANGGINTEFAKKLLVEKRPACDGKRLLFIYDNTETNYYQVKAKKTLNPETAKILAPDTSKTKLVFLNELFGTRPQELYHYQKLSSRISTLYDEEDQEIYRKKKVSARETEAVSLTNKFSKNLLIYAPEFYNWLNENGFNEICRTTVFYDFDEALAGSEAKNDYLVYYANFNVMRPFFKSGIRSGAKKKQSNSEMAAEIVDFLYGKN